MDGVSREERDVLILLLFVLVGAKDRSLKQAGPGQLQYHISLNYITIKLAYELRCLLNYKLRCLLTISGLELI